MSKAPLPSGSLTPLPFLFTAPNDDDVWQHPALFSEQFQRTISLRLQEIAAPELKVITPRDTSGYYSLSQPSADSKNVADKVYSETLIPPPEVPGDIMKVRIHAEQENWSVGTTGHPFTCAKACRYVKRKGGCKNGADCPDCHACFWCRDKTDDATETESRPDVLLETTAHVLLFSVGTIGHPHTCGAACKYRRRKGGCRDGARCVSCHLCNWRRDGLKTLVGVEPQPGERDVPWPTALQGSQSNAEFQGLDQMVIRL
mmetsp:Transcript_23390/g.42252  ORF Transcript_23390/g.42252 Transcript_23390/m.42252 type:complete len:258 (-) Transcript_23390:103-876(-)